MTDLTLIWPDETYADLFAHRLAKLVNASLRQGERVHIELRGELGAGKTTFTRYFLQHMGVTGHIRSPSYSVVHSYEVDGLPPFWHFDFYRFDNPSDWEDAGFREIFDTHGLTIVEWPDNAHGLLPPADLAIHMCTLAEDYRQVSIQGRTSLWQVWQNLLA